MARESLAPRLRVPIDWQLPSALVERLGDMAGRQRSMSTDGHLLIVLHEPPKPGSAERIGRLFWRNPEGTWKSNQQGAGVQALTAHLGEFAARVETLDKRLEVAETAADYYALLRALAPLYRAARSLHAALQQAREMVPDDRDIINARDQANEIERGLDLLHSDATHGLDFTIARQAEEQAEASYQMSIAGYRLNLLAAMFFPIATIATVFGMNLRHGFEEDRTGGVFWSLLVVGLACGTVLAVMIARKPVRRHPKR